MGSDTDTNIPTRAELIQQAVNSDMVRIVTTKPSAALVLTQRLEIARRILAGLAAVCAGITITVALTFTQTTLTPLLIINVVLALLFLGVWGATIAMAHKSRIELLHQYGVAPNRDGVFELLRAGEPHKELAATREMLRVYTEDVADTDTAPSAPHTTAITVASV